MRQSTRQSSATDAPSSRPETCAFVPEKLRDSGTSAAASRASVKNSSERARPQFVLGNGSAGANDRPRGDATLRSFIAPKPGAQAAETSKASAPPAPRRSASLPPPSPRATLPPPPPRASAVLPTPSVGSTRAAVRNLDATLEVSEDDVSILDGQAPYIPPPPPLPRRPRLAQPKVVWGMVAAAWCVMVCLALLAVDEPAPELRPTVATKPTSERASAAHSVAARDGFAASSEGAGALAGSDEASSLRVSAPSKVTAPSASAPEAKAQAAASSGSAAQASTSTPAAQGTQASAAAAAANASTREQAVGAHRDGNKQRIKAGLSKRIKRTKRHRATREPTPERS